MLQREVRHTIGKGHIPEGVVDARVAEGHGEAESLIRFACVACHNLRDSQISGIRFRWCHVFGVRKHCCRCTIFCNRSCIASLGCHIAVIRIIILSHRVGDASRKTSCRLALAVLQREVRHTVREVHITKFSANRLIIERYCEMELPVFIAVRSSNFFCYCQATCFCFCIDIFNGIRWRFLIYHAHILIHYNSSSNLSRSFVFIYRPTSCNNNLFDPIICVFGFCNSIGCSFR